MSNFDTVVLDGEMGLFTTIREGDLPYYTGATEVTPSDQTQTLPTADTIVTSNITVNPVPGEYIDTTDATLDDASLLPSGVTAYADGVKYTGTAAINDDGDLVVSGDTVTAPAGFYEEPAAASVASGSATTPATSITANPSISVGNDGSITASVSATQSVTPTVSAGYVSSGTAGTITVSGSGSSQLSTQAGATITPTTSQQTAVAAGKFTTGAVIVDAMPSGTEGTPTATKGTVSNHSVAVTPSVTNTEGYISGGTKTGTAVTVSASELVSGSQNITSNDTYDVTNLASVTVAVPGDTPTLQTKSVSYTPTESAQSATVTADQGYDGLDEVNISVGAIDSEYVGSAIDRRDSTDLSDSGATVTAPAGYYAAAASKAVASGSASTPATTITANPSISVDSSGLITATASASQSVTPTVSAGFVSSGTSGTVTVSGSATEQLTTQAAQTIHPSTTDQTIASGKYLTGAQTIKAVTTNITADKIVSGFTAEIGDADDPDCVASVTGTASGGTDTITQRIENELTSYEYTGTATLPGGLFQSCTSLKTVSFPNVTVMGGPSGASGAYSRSFADCTNLESVSFPELTTVAGTSNFEHCRKLNTAIFPKLVNMYGSYFLNDCGKGINKTFVFPSIVTLGTDAFRSTDCTVDIGSGLTSLPARVFYSATYSTVILRNSTQVVVATADNSIQGINQNTTVYIPKALYDHLGDGTALDYRSATNWAEKTTTTFACIEGSQYENYYADGTPIPTT